MKLTRVTITGADDEVPHQALYDLSEGFPFVEWGVLRSHSRAGTPRYPTPEWIKNFYYDKEMFGFSVHLCGEVSRLAMANHPDLDDEPWYFWDQIRIQINGFSEFRIPMFALADRMEQVEFILQCNTLEAVDLGTTLRERHPNVSALWDCSGGKGVIMEHWPLPNGSLPIGYAGGIDEHSISALLEKLAANYEPQDFWIDLESGARTDDKFDLAKVRRILELARPFVGAHVGNR